MTWTFTIPNNNQDDPAAGTSWDTESPESTWVVGAPPGSDSTDWIVGLRFVVREHYAVLAEVRFFPNEDTPHKQARGEWSGNPEAVPALGLPATVVKDIALGTMETQARAALADRNYPVWEEDHSPTHDNAEPPEDYWEWSDRTNTTQRRKRGRPPLPDDLLAKVAYYYEEALRNGYKTHRHIESKMRTGNERPPAAQWIKKARERGFLTPTPKSGQRGGSITQKALDVLERIGFLDHQNTTDPEQEGNEA
jgi:hypothetical protein